MAIILHDPVDPGIGTAAPIVPAEPADAPIPRKERQLSVELQSPGGHLRMVAGTIAYLDEEAQTYMVDGPDGSLIRVPIRAITKTFALP
jgi:hypothetical protein